MVLEMLVVLVVPMVSAGCAGAGAAGAAGWKKTPRVVKKNNDQEINELGWKKTQLGCIKIV